MQNKELKNLITKRVKDVQIGQMIYMLCKQLSYFKDIFDRYCEDKEQANLFEIVQNLQWKSMKKGQVLFEENQKTDLNQFYVLYYGKMVVVKQRDQNVLHEKVAQMEKQQNVEELSQIPSPSQTSQNEIHVSNTYNFTDEKDTIKHKTQGIDDKKHARFLENENDKKCHLYAKTILQQCQKKDIEKIIVSGIPSVSSSMSVQQDSQQLQQFQQKYEYMSLTSLSNFFKTHGSPIRTMDTQGTDIGQNSTMDGRPRSATVVALTDCELIILNKVDFLQLISNPKGELLETVFPSLAMGKQYSSDTLDSIMFSFEPLQLRQGQLLTNQNAKGHQVYIISSGEMSVQKQFDVTLFHLDELTLVPQQYRRKFKPDRPILTLCIQDRAGVVGEELLFNLNQTYSYTVRVKSHKASVFAVSLLSIRDKLYQEEKRVFQRHFENKTASRQNMLLDKMRSLCQIDQLQLKLQCKSQALNMDPQLKEALNGPSQISYSSKIDRRMGNNLQQKQYKQSYYNSFDKNIETKIGSVQIQQQQTRNKDKKQLLFGKNVCNDNSDFEEKFFDRNEFATVLISQHQKAAFMRKKVIKDFLRLPSSHLISSDKDKQKLKIKNHHNTDQIKEKMAQQPDFLQKHTLLSNEALLGQMLKFASTVSQIKSQSTEKVKSIAKKHLMILFGTDAPIIKKITSSQHVSNAEIQQVLDELRLIMPQKEFIEELNQNRLIQKNISLRNETVRNSDIQPIKDYEQIKQIMEAFTAHTPSSTKIESFDKSSQKTNHQILSQQTFDFGEGKSHQKGVINTNTSDHPNQTNCKINSHHGFEHIMTNRIGKQQIKYNNNMNRQLNNFCLYYNKAPIKAKEQGEEGEENIFDDNETHNKSLTCKEQFQKQQALFSTQKIISKNCQQGYLLNGFNRNISNSKKSTEQYYSNQSDRQTGFNQGNKQSIQNALSFEESYESRSNNEKIQLGISSNSLNVSSSTQQQLYTKNANQTSDAAPLQNCIHSMHQQNETGGSRFPVFDLQSKIVNQSKTRQKIFGEKVKRYLKKAVSLDQRSSMFIMPQTMNIYAKIK